jgi:hypothetical protein
MRRTVLASILIASVVVILLAVVVIVVRPEPAPPRPLPNIGSIRDLRPVTLPATAPETQPPRTDRSADDATANESGK